jgi:hypothetical protein
VVRKLKKQAQDAQIDLYATIQNRNEICLEKEALLDEKAQLIREKETIRGLKVALERNWQSGLGLQGQLVKLCRIGS